MTLLEKGAYFEVLMLQFSRGHLSLQVIKRAIGEELWDAVKHKFCVDDDGLYFNCRLQEELDKRRAFTASRRRNGEKGGRPSTKNHMDNHVDMHMGSHMGNGNGDGDGDINQDLKEGGCRGEVQASCRR